MNLYVRYFDDEKIVSDADAAYKFLCEATNETLDVKHLEQLREYQNSTMTYTRRFKVRPRVYFVAIKTDLETMEEFKQRGQQMAEERANKAESEPTTSAYNKVKPGWYEGSIIFKRVVFNVDTNKNEYIDTEFIARVKAQSPSDLYQRLCDYILSRPDVDPRSQMPSIKGKNFKHKYLGETLNASASESPEQ